MIAILLATYNSERYLRMQLDSLFNQTMLDFVLYIRDDGSNDSTIDIVREYEMTHNNLVLMQDSQTGRGAMGSFMWMLENTQATYYMFCDHDDYWLPTKIEMTLSEMKRCEHNCHNKAVIVNTDLKVVDQNLNIINSSFLNYAHINRRILSSFNFLSVCNSFTGCTMMMNQKAKEISLPIDPAAVMHDHWIALKVAANDGILGFVPESTILYRQHGNNAVGAIVGKRGFAAFVDKFTHFHDFITRNIITLRMVRAVKPCSICKYTWYKFLYIFYR